MSRLGTTILIGALLATGTQALGADFWRDVGRDLQDAFSEENMRETFEPVVQAFSEDNMRETFEPVVQAFSEDNMRETFAPLVDVAEDAIDALKDAFSEENMHDTAAPAVQAEDNMHDTATPAVQAEENMHDTVAPAVQAEENMHDAAAPAVQAFSGENMQDTFAPAVPLVSAAKNATDALLLQDADEDAVDPIEIDVEQPAPAFVDDYIVLSDDGIEQAFQPLVELANWTIPEIAENITAFFTESIPLEI